MPIVKELEMNKRYTWKEIKDAYPDMWVFLTEVEYDIHKINSAVLVAISTFEQRDETYRLTSQKYDKIIMRRTTPSFFPTVGVL